MHYNKKELNFKLIKRIAYSYVFYMAASLSIMIFLSTVKEETYASEEIISIYSNEDRYMKIQSEEIQVLKPKDMNMNNLEIKEDYLNNTIKIMLNGDYIYHFKENSIEYSKNNIKDIIISYDNIQDKTIVKFKFDNIKCYEIKEEADKFLFKFANPKEIYDKVLVIDPGHGGNDEGKGHNGLQEKVIVLNIAQALKEKLDILEKEQNIKVFYTRLEDVKPSLTQRVDIAEKLGADLFLSIHANAFVSLLSVNGTETFYSLREEEALDFAIFLQKNIVDVMKTRDRGIKDGEKLYVIRENKTPAVLVELGFLTNSKDAEKLKSEKYQLEIAEAIANTIHEVWFNK